MRCNLLYFLVNMEQLIHDLRLFIFRICFLTKNNSRPKKKRCTILSHEVIQHVKKMISANPRKAVSWYYWSNSVYKYRHWRFARRYRSAETRRKHDVVSHFYDRLQLGLGKNGKLKIKPFHDDRSREFLNILLCTVLAETRLLGAPPRSYNLWLAHDIR
jgi:hypothetical protein